jgi:type I restriction enzyme S subunit
LRARSRRSDTGSEWKETALGDLIRLQKGVSYKGEFLDKPGPRLLGLGTIALGGGLMLDKARTYSGPIRNGQWAEPGDLIVAVVGITPEGSVIGSPALIPQDARGPFAVTHHVARATLLRKGSADLRFLYYFLRNKDFLEYVRCVQFGSTVPAVALQDVLDYSAPFPPFAEQRAIARVLGSLDDKIELNRRMNRRLEEIARALFKSWFVDFDPVRAKAEGRWKNGESLPGMPADMWDLWPSEFEDSEIGEIPKGWEIGGLGTVASCTRDLVDPSEIDPDLRYVGLEHIAPRSLSLWNWGRVGDTVSGKARFKQGEILFGKLRPYFHKVCIPAFDGVASTDILTVSPKTSDWFAFTLGHLDSDALVDYVTGASNGTKMPRTSWQDLAGWQVALPPSKTAGALTRLTNPLFSKMAESIEEVGTLSSTRDALLPKLLSGEIRVPVNGGK